MVLFLQCHSFLSNIPVDLSRKATERQVNIAMAVLGMLVVEFEMHECSSDYGQLLGWRALVEVIMCSSQKGSFLDEKVVFGDLQDPTDPTENNSFHLWCLYALGEGI